ncbi:hypothetical protein HMPREF3224_02300 [Anaerococcus hydrogenalis]|nr:hypothetical protein HMPREF3224_02300 [Anaerococcus hydrogenalis]
MSKLISTARGNINIQGSTLLGQQVDITGKVVHKISDDSGREEGSISIDERTRFTNLVLF